MIALWIIAAHMTGDFLLQSRTMAAWKLTSWRVRARHVTIYLIPFAPVAAAYARSWPLAAAFLVAVWITHFLIDSRRFHSTLMDVIEWRIRWQHDPGSCVVTWYDFLHSRQSAPSSLTMNDLTGSMVKRPPPSSWQPLPILIDQTLHLLTLAAAAAILTA